MNPAAADSGQHSLLALNQVRAGYGETIVLDGIDLPLAEGEVCSLIGRNGVGKSTLLATVMGQTDQHSGEILLAGQPIQSLKCYRRVALGLAYVPQERDIFASLSVDENLAVACRGASVPNDAYELFPHLKARRNQRSNQLSGGEQQMLAIGRALLAEPKLMLLDEPSEGLAPVIVDRLFGALQALRDETRLALLLVEQNSHVALQFAPRCVVMNRGQIVNDGPSAELLEDTRRLSRLIGVEGG